MCCHCPAACARPPGAPVPIVVLGPPPPPPRKSHVPQAFPTDRHSTQTQRCGGRSIIGRRLPPSGAPRHHRTPRDQAMRTRARAATPAWWQGVRNCLRRPYKKPAPPSLIEVLVHDKISPDLPELHSSIPTGCWNLTPGVSARQRDSSRRRSLEAASMASKQSLWTTTPVHEPFLSGTRTMEAALLPISLAPFGEPRSTRKRTAQCASAAPPSNTTPTRRGLATAAAVGMAVDKPMPPTYYQQALNDVSAGAFLRSMQYAHTPRRPVQASRGSSTAVKLPPISPRGEPLYDEAQMRVSQPRFSVRPRYMAASEVLGAQDGVRDPR